MTLTRRRVRVSKYIILVNTVGANVGAKLSYIYFININQLLNTVIWRTDSNAQLSFAPRFICERTTTATTTQDCGTGAEIGLSSNSEDGLSSANIRFVMDRVGNSNRSNVVFNVEHRF